jgi:transcriptional regulator with XRE-family HTH domain
MSDEVRITGRVIAAARALAGVSKADFAAAAGLSVESLQKMEAAGSAWIQQGADAANVIRGLDHLGVVLVNEGDGMGAGVRLKFTRQDARQITNLEGEGGIVGLDDAP